MQSWLVLISCSSRWTSFHFPLPAMIAVAKFYHRCSSPQCVDNYRLFNRLVSDREWERHNERDPVSSGGRMPAL
jgi:hypothetical protein